MTNPPIRDAATVILVRDPDTQPKVLMGQRGANAAFMPNKFVFPGGAVDQLDANISLADSLAEPCASRLNQPKGMANALAIAAIRELWEEAGLILGSRGKWQGLIPADWADFVGTGHLPSATGLRYVFRAITPPGRPRRFDARFFMADAKNLANDADDFSRASDELSHLQWVALNEARRFDLPFITEVVLAEISASLPRIDAPNTVPFFKNSDEESLFLQLGGQGAVK